jgi:adenine-specific DNA-methyltransferase
MMRDMLRPGGVLAICIDHRELYRLGMLLDSIFTEKNRLGIINWQKSYSPRNDRRHVSTATEYVLVYARGIDRATTSLTARTDRMNARYTQPDGDTERWKSGDISAMGASSHPGMLYAVQNPFTGHLQYPPEGRHWGSEKRRMKAWLEEWGSKYIERDLGDGRPKALIIKGAPLPTDGSFSPSNSVLKAARKAAEKVRDAGPWPEAYWSDRGLGGLSHKRYLSTVKNGYVPTTFWSNEDYDDPLDIETVSWVHQQSGHSQTGINELTAIMGRSHGFDTVKPLKLFKKIISIWCPPDGIVMDPFAGSGTAAHAVLDLNAEADADRSFVLIEQGRKERSDPYARTLTAERVRRVIDGLRVDKSGKLVKSTAPLSGGFRYQRLMQRVDADAVLALEREEMVDLLLTSFWSDRDRGAAHLGRLPAGEFKHLFALGLRGEGFFLVWDGPDKPSNLNQAVYRAIAEEASSADLKAPFHIFARRATYPGPGTEFYKIPNRILERMGFNEAIDAFSPPQEADIDIDE